MFRRFFLAVVVAGTLSLGGLAIAQDQAQPKLPTIPLLIGEKKLVAEIADEPTERETGMMHRTELGENEGMLFVFPGPTQLAFWMRNTTIPLSVAYINPDGVILEIHDLQPLDETPVPSVFDSALYALETHQGWFAENGIMAGDTIQGLPGPSRE